VKTLRLLAVIATFGLPASTCGGAETSPEILPDLDQAVPQGVTVERVGNDYRLTFLSAVDNAGAGTLLIDGDRAPTARAMTVTQVIRRQDGTQARYVIPGDIVFVQSETHRHWHLLRFERYELRRLGDGTLVAPDRKTGFCLGDRYDAKALEPPTKPPEPVLTGECGKGRPGLLRVRQGISPGYGDDYVPMLEGQYVDVTDVPAGRYVLVHLANPDRTVREKDYTNNAASVLLALRQNADGTREVEVLASCPDSATCSA
jgi:hypothetical protein